MKLVSILFLLLNLNGLYAFEIQSDVESARTLGLNWFSTARETYSQRSGSDWQRSTRRLLRKSEKALRQAQIHTPSTGLDFEQCDGITLAFKVLNTNYNTQNHIYICRLFLARYSNYRAQYPDYAKKYFAQVLVHESLHIGGTTNECETSFWEKFVLESGNGELAFENSFLSSCDFSEGIYF